MSFRQLVLSISGVFALSASLLCYYYERSWQNPTFVFIASLILSFLILSIVVEKFIYKRISTIYKLIHNLKLGKELKNALGDHVSHDPIADAEKQVRDWASQKSLEIEKLKGQEKFRKEFLSNISHEFKTPLFAVQGYIETLQGDMLEEDPQLAKSFLAKAERNLDRLTYLIEDLDDISKLESGRITLHKDRFDLISLIKETIDYLDDKAKKNNISLILRTKPSATIFVKADRNRIQQVLTNLIDNSIKYGKAGGTTKIYVFQLIDQILVEVTDDGQGIDENNLSRIFERLYRADKSRSREVGGSGLGLAIAKHIIEAHDQNVHARSTEGIGTTIGFTLDKA